MSSLFKSTTTYDPIFTLLNAESEDERDRLTESWRDHKLEELNFIGIVVGTNLEDRMRAVWTSSSLVSIGLHVLSFSYKWLGCFTCRCAHLNRILACRPARWLYTAMDSSRMLVLWDHSRFEFCLGCGSTVGSFASSILPSRCQHLHPSTTESKASMPTYWISFTSKSSSLFVADERPVPRHKRPLYDYWNVYLDLERHWRLCAFLALVELRSQISSNIHYCVCCYSDTLRHGTGHTLLMERGRWFG